MVAKVLDDVVLLGRGWLAGDALQFTRVDLTAAHYVRLERGRFLRYARGFTPVRATIALDRRRRPIVNVSFRNLDRVR